MSRLAEPCTLIPGREPPRTYYQVLDISPGEQDPKVIEEAAVRCSGHVRAYQLTRESECTLRLNEIAQALITLLDPVHRREYDLGLDKPPGPAVLNWPPSGKQEPRGKSSTPIPAKDTLVLLVDDGGTCDVKLVYRKRAL